MSYDINSQQVDIENLFKQNELDLCSIKELYRKLKDLEKKITQIKYIDSNLADKLKKDYESLKRKILKDYEELKSVILDENIQAKLTDDINKINSQLDNIMINKVERRNKLNYKTVSITVKPNLMPLDSDCLKLKEQGANATLVAMCSVNNINDSNIINIDLNTVKNAIDKIRNNGIDVDMLKPHIGLNYSDSFFRGNYNPTDFNLAFNNWKSILLDYAKICNDKNIKVLCLSTEQELMEVNQYSEKWKDIYNSIKSLYPNLQLVHARTTQSAMSSDTEIYKYCDMIGINVYLSYSIKNYDGNNISYTDVCKGFYKDLKGFTVIPHLYELSRKYNKDVFITEIGVMNKDDGLRQALATGTTNNEIQGLFYNAVMENLLENKIIKGIAIWHAGTPFSYFDSPSAIKVITQYFKGGIR